jgi:5-methylcytosine-specific restriction endonuclease McrA
VNGAVLVLNQNYEPLNICNVRRAILLVFDGKAEVLEASTSTIHSATCEFEAPSVIRMVYHINRPRPRVKLTRKEVFIRDGYTCQYCGRKGHDLTIDHVIPRHRGGPHTWDNLVSACKPCNHRKGGKLLKDSRMTLRTQPREPRAGRYYTIERRIEGNMTQEWLKFLPGLAPVSPFSMESSTERGGSRAAR